jgi:hypothetical protein
MSNMKIFFTRKALLLPGILLLAMACEKKYLPKPPAPPPPKVGLETSTLEASYVTSAPLTLSDAYWKSADFLKVPLADLTKNQLYGDGFLNMTNTFNGLASFNNGTDPRVVMKAAYDNNKVYLYVEWVDNNFNPGFGSAMVNGPADPLKSDTTNGWTSQWNSDKMSLAFDIGNASGDAGTFSAKGCAASCHGGKKQTAAGSVDMWCWDLAVSDPLGYAKDMVCDAANGLANDAGTGYFLPNRKNPSDPRSGPAYEWDGTEQSVVRPDGKTTVLDPGYYLLNKTAFTGDYKTGKSVFHNTALSDCAHCHGYNGANGEATEFANVSFARKFSRSSLKTFAASESHEGNSYWARTPIANVDDLIAYIKGIGSVPGVYLTTPSGSTADVWTVSNVLRARINTGATNAKYTVLMVRNLTTANSDDVQFTSPEGKAFKFGLALMNGDAKNHVGSTLQTLTFKTKPQ